MTDVLGSEVEGLFPLEGELPEAEQAPAPQEQKPEPVAEAPVIEPEPVAETGEQKVEEKDHRVPLATFLEEKLAARELKKENERLRQEAEALRKPPEPVKIPDPYEDPEGYTRYQQGQMQDQAFALRLEMSGQFAEQAHGKEKVEAAVAWAQEEGAKDPTFGQRLRVQNNPVGWVVEQYNRDQFFSKYGSDPSALTALQQQAQAAQGTVAPQSTAQVLMPVSVTPRQAPPRSLATAPSTSGHQTIPNGAVLDSVKFNLD